MTDVQMTAVEFENAKRLAAQEQAIKMLGENLIDGRKADSAMLSRVASDVGRLREEIQKWPDRMTKCRDDIETDMRAAHLGFMTHTDGELLEQRLKNEFAVLRTQVRQTVITVIAVASTVQFILLMGALYFQITG